MPTVQVEWARVADGRARKCADGLAHQGERAAKLGTIRKGILRHYGYLRDLQVSAMNRVFPPAELLTTRWTD